METKNWLYFSKSTDEVNNINTAQSICFPADRLVSIAPSANNAVTILFKSVQNNMEYMSHAARLDSVVLTTTVGDAFEVANELVKYINKGGRNNDGFIIIADAMTTTHATAGGEGLAFNDLTVSPIFAHPSITAVSSINIRATNWRAQFMDLGAVGTENPNGGALTNISAGALGVNAQYQSIAAATAMTLPSAATGNPGDWINVYYNVAIGDGNAHTFTTHADDTAFALGSTLRTAGGSHADRIPRSDVAVAADNIITITGATNGDGGVGSYVRFVNMSGIVRGWAAEVYVTAQGTGVTAGTAAFS